MVVDVVSCNGYQQGDPRILFIIEYLEVYTFTPSFTIPCEPPLKEVEVLDSIWVLTVLKRPSAFILLYQTHTQTQPRFPQPYPQSPLDPSPRPQNPPSQSATLVVWPCQRLRTSPLHP